MINIGYSNHQISVSCVGNYLNIVLFNLCPGIDSPDEDSKSHLNLSSNVTAAVLVISCRNFL